MKVRLKPLKDGSARLEIPDEILKQVELHAGDLVEITPLVRSCDGQVVEYVLSIRKLRQ